MWWVLTAIRKVYTWCANRLAAEQADRNSERGKERERERESAREPNSNSIKLTAPQQKKRSWRGNHTGRVEDTGITKKNNNNENNDMKNCLLCTIETLSNRMVLHWKSTDLSFIALARRMVIHAPTINARSPCVCVCVCARVYVWHVYLWARVCVSVVIMFISSRYNYNSTTRNTILLRKAEFSRLFSHFIYHILICDNRKYIYLLFICAHYSIRVITRRFLNGACLCLWLRVGRTQPSNTQPGRKTETDDTPTHIKFIAWLTISTLDII